MTIYDIKKAVAGQSHFFDKETLKGQSQTLKDFKVNKTGHPYVYRLIAPSFDISTQESGLTEWWYNDNTKRLHPFFLHAVNSKPRSK